MRCEVTGGVLLLGFLLVSVFRLASAQDAEAGFSFTIPHDGLVEGSAPALLARPEAPAGAEGFVQVVGDRLALSDTGRPIRFWGTNLCFAGNFPPRDVADRMAARLASLGINCVRFHHMDAATFPRGIWQGDGWGDFPHEQFSPEALDRLDYLVAQLKRNGVYANLNLHVSRRYGARDGFPAVGEGESVPNFGKGVDVFYPRAVEEQKRYARMLLRHVNRYTGVAYAEEPAVAMVEINNEDGLLHQWAGGGLDNLPPGYLQELARQWNAWLDGRYGSTDALRAAWADGERAGSDADLLAAPEVRAGLQTLGGAQAELLDAPSEGQGGRIVVRQASQVGWHVQYIWGPLAVQEGAPYVLRIRLRANREAQIGINCMMAHEPWGNLGLSRNVQVTPEWREHEFYFAGTADDAPGAEGGGGARITLTGLSQEGLELSFAEPSLVEAPMRGLPAGEGLDPVGVTWPKRDRLAGRTPAVQRDVVTFLRETEVAYWRDMRDYLHNELGVRMPVTGTAIGYVTPHIAAETADFLDSHAYWRHPRFPGRPWDADNWYVSNDVMVNDPEGATIAGLAARRVFGFPYTVTEYNHPQPHHYAVEGFPLVAVYGSLQAWDGLFQFAYSHNDRWETDHFQSFFDMRADPAKLALMPACADIFGKGRVGPAEATAGGQLPLEQRIELLATNPRAIHAHTGGVDGLAWQRARVGVWLNGDEPTDAAGPPAEVEWELSEGRGLVRFVGQGCAGLIGFAEGRTVSAGGLALTPGPTALDGFSVVLLNSVDGQALGDEGRYLITAASRCWNRNMGWNKERNSVGRRWGDGPTQCDGVPAVLGADVGGRRVRLYALSPDGSRRAEVPAREGDAVVFDLGSGYRTLWYELVIGG